MRGILIILAVSLILAGCTTPPADVQEEWECTGPVCGGNGITYTTDCDAWDAGTFVERVGECADSGSEDGPTCTDTDNGMQPTIPGTVLDSSGSHEDYCLDEQTLVEFTCEDGHAANLSFSCGSGKRCAGARCIPDTSQTEDDSEPEEDDETPLPATGCTGPSEPDTFKRENVSFNNTVYTDICVDYKIVKDYYCHGDELMSTNNECEPGFGCDGGICVEVRSKCTETDDGNDTINRGTTTVAKGIHVSFSGTDECVDDGTILEHICMPDGSKLSSELPCGSGLKCFNGRCVRSDCSETDDGMDIYVSGTTTARELEYEDNCLDENRIREYFCYGEEIEDRILNCGEGYVCMHDECVVE